MALAAGSLVLGGRNVAKQRLQIDLDAAAAKRRVAELQADKGAAAAHVEVANAYAQTRSQLSQDDRQRAQALAHDPPALAAFLVRAARGPNAGADSQPYRSGPTA